jgi:hypothetical protein
MWCECGVLAVKEKKRRRFVKALRRDEVFRVNVRHELLTAEILNLSQAVGELVVAVGSVVSGDGEQRRQLAHIRSEIAAVEGTLRNGFVTLNDMDTDKVERLGDPQRSDHRLRADLRSLRSNPSRDSRDQGPRRTGQMTITSTASLCPTFDRPVLFGSAYGICDARVVGGLRWLDL